jgi:heme-degrading monooxygenase HmoA
MFAVIFEVQPRRERWDDYLGIAGALRTELEKIDGFIDNERFASRSTQGRILSLSTWRDEKAIIRWRTLERHHAAQARGRSEIFEDYRLRVGEIFADSDVPLGQELRQQRLDETETGLAKAVTISELGPGDDTGGGGSDNESDFGVPTVGANGVVAREAFVSISEPRKQLLLVSWTDASAASRWPPTKVAGRSLRHRAVRIIRDYGIFDRREAPQYHPPVGAASERC